MIDGPFKKAPLSRSWKHYGNELHLDASSLAERTAHACHSMLSDVSAVGMKQFTSLQSDLKAHFERPQMDLFPTHSVENIFFDYPVSPFTDNLKKQLTANFRDLMPFATAWALAVDSSTGDLIQSAHSSFKEELICMRDHGKIKPSVCVEYMARHDQVFEAIDRSAIRDALISGNKRGFKAALAKNRDLDGGPE